ncbi:MAG: AMP-binding protein [Pseudomonadota bacterium]
MPNASIYAAFEMAFAEHADRTAFEGADVAPTSYRALAGAVDAMAGALDDLGVQPGDRVMAQIEKSHASVVLYLATLKVGGVYNPLNTAYTAAELDYFITDAEPRVIVIDPAKTDTLTPVAMRAGVAHVETLDAAGRGSLADKQQATATRVATAVRAGDDLAALLYTSGTTGRSKGAMITHRNLASNARTLVALWGITSDDVLIHALPIFHVHGLFVALNTAFVAGARMLWHARFDADAVLDDMPKATMMMGVPTFYTRLLANDRLTREHAASMRLFISGSAPLLAETHDAFTERSGQRILERYGMTEAGMITSNPYRRGERVAGTVGYPLDGVQVRIADDNGTPVATGEVGVLEVRGPNVFIGYWRMPEKTAEEFRDDGFFVSGDLAMADADGRISIVGRAKDLIISGGYNIYPKEIEDALNAIDSVGESAVIGVPHADFGEAVVAVVTPSGQAGAPNPDAIVSGLAEQLARFKLPKAVIVAETLPRNAMGKVQKAELRARHKDAVQPPRS